MAKRPLLIYLDHLHWIHLAQASKGHIVGQNYVEAYKYLLSKKKANEIVCPLSLTHYMELAATGSYRQRNDVANVMAQLSTFQTLSPISILKRVELEKALFKYFGKPKIPKEINLLGVGAFFAARGENKMMKFSGSEKTMQDFSKVMGGDEQIKQLEYKYTLLAEFEILRGPDLEQEQLLRAKYDYKPELAIEEAKKRAAQEDELANELKNDPTKFKKIDDIVTARYLYWELSDALTELLASSGMTMEEFMKIGKERVTNFVHDMPTADIITTLTKLNLKNLNRSWVKNDIHDMDALAVAVPYCDVVVTEKHSFTQLINAKLGIKYDTTLLKNLEDIPEVVNKLLR